MLPEAEDEDLMYTTDDSQEVYVYSYPAGKPVGILSGFQTAEGLCTDEHGHVFVADFNAQDIIEYAHGRTKPIASLSDSGNYPNGCAVDPATGDLAVGGGLRDGNVAIYANASGSPVVYTDGSDSSLFWCTYDSQSNLFIDPWDQFYGGSIVELPAGSSKLVHIYIDSKMNPGGGLQWDGQHVVVENPAEKTKGPSTLYQLDISGSNATIVNTITLAGGRTKHKNKNPRIGNEFWLIGNKVVDYTRWEAGIWAYPAGGYARKLFQANGGMGLVISLTPR
jgi:hypothetical protein